MIRKIKKYKINVRPFGVLRQLKKQISIEAEQQPEDSVLEALIAQVQNHVTPCALYASFSKTEIPEALAPLWQSSPPKSLSLSVVAATIGQAIDHEIEKNSQSENKVQGALWASVARESLEQSFKFAEKLIEGEAEDESCVLTPLLPAADANIGPILEILESTKAEITQNDSGQIIPQFTGLRYCFWTPAKGRSAKK